MAKLPLFHNSGGGRGAHPGFELALDFGAPPE
jgi:hypothetical protein